MKRNAIRLNALFEIKFHLKTAAEPIETIDTNLPEREDLLLQIDDERQKHGW
jgi:hypothetical protein